MISKAVAYIVGGIHIFSGCCVTILLLACISRLGTGKEINAIFFTCFLTSIVTLMYHILQATSVFWIVPSWGSLEMKVLQSGYESIVSPVWCFLDAQLTFFCSISLLLWAL
jgi:hypothetical protein